jgi:hypothetical protein
MNNITKSPYYERRGRPTIYGDIAKLYPGDCMHIPTDTINNANLARIGASTYARTHGIRIKTQVNKTVPEALIFCIKNKNIAKKV